MILGEQKPWISQVEASTVFSTSPQYTMALPPQLIGIKRRRHDEPVDVLCKDLACVHTFTANQHI
jgi:hypothetical protein